MEDKHSDKTGGISTSFKKRKRHSSSESSTSDDKKEKRKKHKRKHKKSSHSSSDNSSDDRRRRKKKKSKSKKRKDKKKSKCKEKTNDGTENGEDGFDVPISLMTANKEMAPMTKGEWEKRQSVVKRVFDESSGRYRLIKGDGEVIEEIVSRERHKDINQQATRGDGTYFQSHMSTVLKK